MKNLILTTIVLSFFSSCVTIEFENPQPAKAKPLEEFPEKLRGNYLLKIVDGKSELSKDSVDFFIGNNYFIEPDKKFKVYLSDSCVLNSFEDNYIISLKTNEDQYWTVGLIKQQTNFDLTIYGLFDGDNNEDRFITEINKITAVQRIPKRDGGHGYVVNPKAKEFKSIVNRGYFKPVYELVKVKE